MGIVAFSLAGTLRKKGAPPRPNGVTEEQLNHILKVNTLKVKSNSCCYVVFINMKHQLIDWT